MEERRSKERAPGATDEASAALMGHSTAAWDKAYDLRCGLRESEKAIEGWHGVEAGHACEVPGGG